MMLEMTPAWTKPSCCVCPWLNGMRISTLPGAVQSISAPSVVMNACRPKLSRTLLSNRSTRLLSGLFLQLLGNRPDRFRPDLAHAAVFAGRPVINAGDASGQRECSGIRFPVFTVKTVFGFLNARAAGIVDFQAHRNRSD